MTTNINSSQQIVNPLVPASIGAIAGAGTVIAVNIDKQARIFDYADYGIIDDVKNITIGE